MARSTQTIDICDGPCRGQFPEGTLSLFPAGSRLGAHTLRDEKMLCPKCLMKELGVQPEVVERTVYVETSSSSSGSRSGGSGRATGRPFPSQASVTTTPGWSTPLLSSGSLSVFAPGLVSSPCGSEPRSTLLARLLSCPTLGT